MKLTVDARMAWMSGIGRYIRSVLPYLCSEFDVTIIASKNADLGFLGNSSYSVIELNSDIYSIGEQLRLRSKIRPCDIFWSPHYNVPLIPVRSRRRAVTIHDVYHLAFYDRLTLPQKFYARVVMDAAVSRSDIIFTNSEFSRRELFKLTCADSNRVRMVHPGVDLEKFSRVPAESEVSAVRAKYRLPDKFILFTGNVKPNKNLVRLLLAVKAQKEINLVIAGRSSGFITADTEVLSLIGQDIELAGRVSLTESVSDDELICLYRMASVFVFPSLYEGFGLPPLEAQAAGCPVAASDIAPLRETGEASFAYFDPYDINSIGTTISELYGNAYRRERLIDAGSKNCSRFGWDRTVAGIVGGLKSLL